MYFGIVKNDQVYFIDEFTKITIKNNNEIIVEIF